MLSRWWLSSRCETLRVCLSLTSQKQAFASYIQRAYYVVYLPLLISQVHVVLSGKSLQMWDTPLLPVVVLESSVQHPSAFAFEQEQSSLSSVVVVRSRVLDGGGIQRLLDGGGCLSQSHEPGNCTSYNRFVRASWWVNPSDICCS